MPTSADRGFAADAADEHVRPHLDSSALLAIDLQVDFTDGGLTPVPGTDTIVDPVAELVRAFRSAGRPVVHVVRLYDGADVDLVRRDLCLRGAGPVRPGTPGSQVVGGLLPDGAELDPSTLLTGDLQQVGAAEWVLWKPRWSAFFRTGLDEHLRRLGVDTVVLAGCNFPNCPRATAFDASNRDYRVVIVPEAISGATAGRVADCELIGAFSSGVAEVRAALLAAPTPASSLDDRVP